MGHSIGGETVVGSRTTGRHRHPLPIAVVIMAKLSGKTDDTVGGLTGVGADFPQVCGGS
jgi:hypothetical protein